MSHPDPTRSRTFDLDALNRELGLLGLKLVSSESQIDEKLRAVLDLADRWSMPTVVVHG